jgi:hypothetical protein
MKTIFLWILGFWTFHEPATESIPADFTPSEKKLWEEIQQYRKSKKLPAIAWSPALTKVARLHAADLRDFPPKAPCNMHSWSGKTPGAGTGCCYSSDHKNPGCMWEKPQELAGYPAQGFEISAMNTGPDPAWLAQWKTSSGHHQVIINQGIWKNVSWKAMGLAIRPPYAVVWFGQEPDSSKSAGH